MQEAWVWSLDGEDPLEEGTATPSSFLACEIPWTEEPGGLQSICVCAQTQLKWLSTHTDGKTPHSIINYPRGLDLWDLKPYHLRWIQRSNNRNRVYNKCNALESSQNHCLVHGKICLPWKQSLVPERLGTTELSHSFLKPVVRCHAISPIYKLSINKHCLFWKSRHLCPWELSMARSSQSYRPSSKGCGGG